MSTGIQTAYLFLLAIPVACISWTVTHEEIFREPREFCKKASEQNKSAFLRRFFYIFTCEYCFSHYVAIGIVILTKFRLLYGNWIGYVLAGFSIVWIANIYMGLYSKIRLDIKKERIEITKKESNKE